MNVSTASASLSSGAAPSDKQIPSPIPQKAFSSASQSFSGKTVTQTDAESNLHQRIQARETAAAKFSITTSWWPGTTISIPEENFSPDQKTFSGTALEEKEISQQLTQLSDTGKEQEHAANYVQSLITTACPDVSTEDAKRLHGDLTTYLSPASTTSKTEEHLGEKLKLHLEDYERATATPQQMSLVHKLDDETHLADDLEKLGIFIDDSNPIGKGSFGEVYAATIDGKPYVYKQEVTPSSLNSGELNGKPWRTGDIAAARLKDLPHFAKATFFILEITQPGATHTDTYCVPTAQAKDFLKQLPPKTDVKIAGQLMERAPGKELISLYSEPSFKPVEHFNHIANTLFEFLEKSFVRNFIHRDLKPENFIYDPATKQGTIIDAGLGGVYGKRSKMLSRLSTTQSNNPLYSRRSTGTPYYAAPAVIRSKQSGGKPYGSEVDFHSAGAMLTELLDPKRFAETARTFAKGSTITPEKIPTNTKEYLRIKTYRKQLDQILKDHPDMQKTIDLFFEVANSYEQDEREEAFQELKQHIETVVRPTL